MSDIHHFPIQVYYEDTNFSGHVYHANYLKYCERARSGFLRDSGVNQTAMFAAGSAFVVRKINCDFLSPTKFDDVLDVETRVVNISGARFELVQNIRSLDKTVFSAHVTVAIVDKSGRPQRINENLKLLVSANFDHV